MDKISHPIKLSKQTKTSCVYKVRRFLQKKFDIWDHWDLLPYRWKYYYWDYIKPIFKPAHKKLRKAIPRRWTDTTTLIVDLNFEMIKNFYEDEYSQDIVDWSATEEHQAFANWLEEAYKYITVERPQLEIDLSNSYPKHDWDSMFVPTTDKETGEKMYEWKNDGIPYEVKYAKTIELEDLIYKTDTKILTEMINNRGFFWT